MTVQRRAGSKCNRSRLSLKSTRMVYVAYPIGLKGVVVGEGDTYAQAVDDVTSAIKFHIETFGLEVD